MMLRFTQISLAAISPALKLLPARMDTPMARLMLLAIGLQESRLTNRFQVITGGGKGPARGLWQFERAGGVRGVLEHSATKATAGAVCLARQLQPDAANVWAALEFDDVLAAAFARLMLFSDPKPLPAAVDVAGCWDLYARAWRPGKPHPETWPAFHSLSKEFLAL